MRRQRSRTAPASRQEPTDPLLAHFTRIESQARGLEAGRQRAPADLRREALAALADLGLVLQALRSAHDGIRREIDGTLAARRVTQAYRRAGALSGAGGEPSG